MYHNIRYTYAYTGTDTRSGIVYPIVANSSDVFGQAEPAMSYDNYCYSMPACRRGLNDLCVRWWQRIVKKKDSLRNAAGSERVKEKSPPRRGLKWYARSAPRSPQGNDETAPRELRADAGDRGEEKRRGGQW